MNTGGMCVGGYKTYNGFYKVIYTYLKLVEKSDLFSFFFFLILQNTTRI